LGAQNSTKKTNNQWNKNRNSNSKNDGMTQLLNLMNLQFNFILKLEAKQFSWTVKGTKSSTITVVWHNFLLILRSHF
jgi:hypothetical protein